MIHGGEQVRLLEIEALGVAFEKADGVRDEAPLVEAGVTFDGVADGGVQRPAPRQRLLHEVPAREAVSMTSCQRRPSLR